MGQRGRFRRRNPAGSFHCAPVRYDGSGMPHYETDKNAVYMPRQRNFEHYHDYIQETLRQIVSATGHQQRLAREGMVMKNGMAPSEDALKQERLIVEVASGIKMLELGLPARLSEESLKTVVQKILFLLCRQRNTSFAVCQTSCLKLLLQKGRL